MTVSLELILGLAGILLGSNWLGMLVLEIYKNKRHHKTPQENMLLSLGRDRLLRLAKKYNRLKSIPEDEVENFQAMYDAYVSMGGNTIVKRLCEDALKLPIRSDEK